MSEQETEVPVKKTRGRRKAVPAPALSDDQFSQLLQVLAAGQQKTGGGLDPESLKEMFAGVARVAADHTEKVRNPSNKTHPGISAFSYPEGDEKHPKAAIPFAFLYNGYPCTKFLETEHWRECELMAQVKPGEYTVIRNDGTKMAVKVAGETDADGKLTKVDVQFAQSREEKNLTPPKAVVLYQIVHAGTKPPKRLFVEGLNEWLSITLGDQELVEA